MRVCLDAGHGGADPGAVANRLFEHKLNLAIAKQVKTFLEGEGDIEVVMTRPGEIPHWSELGLLDRCQISNAAQADCFVSIHCNAANGFEAYGSETFYCPGSANGAALARACLSHMVSECPEIPERRCVQKGFYVLRHTHAPAALVECGFLTNSVDAGLLGQPEFQARCARGIAAGILQWLKG